MASPASLFRSALATILFILKRSDVTAPLPSTGNPAQEAVVQTSKTTKMLLLALEFVSGFLFGSGLVVAGMVNPAKVMHACARKRRSCIFKVTAFLSALPGVCVAFESFLSNYTKVLSLQV